jgi:hypothetical protein
MDKKEHDLGLILATRRRCPNTLAKPAHASRLEGQNKA